MAFITISLKLHNMGAAKAAAIDAAMERFRAGLSALLAQFRPRAHECAKLGKIERMRAIDAFLKEARPSVGFALPFTDSLMRRFKGIMLSYFTHLSLDPGVRYPEARQGGSVFFCRYSSAREYCLVYDVHKKRYYAKLHLKGRADEPFAPPRAVEPGRFEGVGLSANVLSRHPRYMLAPLSFGRRQLEILEHCRALDYKPVTANLVRKNNAYYLNVTVRTPERAQTEPKTYLGVSRAALAMLSVSIVDLSGALMCARMLNAPGSGAERVHVLANSVVGLAEKYGSQAVTENLGRYDKLALDGLSPGLPVREYMDFERILSYKLAAAGLPRPVRLSPTQIFSTCPGCGCVSKRNRALGEVFLCVRCGLAMKIDELGSLNLARGIIKNGKKPVVFTRVELETGKRLYKSKNGLECEAVSLAEFYEWLGVISDAPSGKAEASLALRIKKDGVAGSVCVVDETGRVIV